MRIATYNIEWFTHLFDDENMLRDDGGWSRRHNVTRARQIEAIGTVLQTLDADAILVVEAPDTNRHRSTKAALETFAERFRLRARRAVIGFPNHTEQEIALLFCPDAISVVHAPQATSEAPRFDGSFRIDLDIDAKPDTVQFSKPPLELEIQTKTTLLRLIGAHLKSKAPHGARSPEEAMRLSIAARRKQLAQCIWLRRRIDGHLSARDPLIVLGDFNDGPGLDEYEKLFGRSGVEIVLGEERAQDAQLFDPNARRALSSRISAAPTTARFYIESENRYLEALLDYIMISPDLRSFAPKWKVWHPFDDPECYNSDILRAALVDASDHFPVTLDLDV